MLIGLCSSSCKMVFVVSRDLVLARQSSEEVNVKDFFFFLLQIGDSTVTYLYVTKYKVSSLALGALLQESDQILKCCFLLFKPT